MTAQSTAYCPVCQRQTLYAKEGLNHVLHLILTLVTLGLWGIVWIILGIASAAKPTRCTQCGTTRKEIIYANRPQT